MTFDMTQALADAFDGLADSHNRASAEHPFESLLRSGKGSVVFSHRCGPVPVKPSSRFASCAPSRDCGKGSKISQWSYWTWRNFEITLDGARKLSCL